MYGLGETGEGFGRIVTEDYRRRDGKCPRRIREAFEKIKEEFERGEEGREELRKRLKLCMRPREGEYEELMGFMEDGK